MTPPNSTSAQVDMLIRQYDPEIQKLINAARRILGAAFPGATEGLDARARVLGYSYGPGYKGTVATLILSKAGGDGPGAARVQNGSEGHERLRVDRATLVDSRVRGSRVLESQDPSADLLQSAGRANIPPVTIARTQLALAGKSETQMLDAINSALDKKELPALEPGAMCYMLSKQGYLGDQAGHFHPHLMFWAERTEPKSWGAGMPGSPMIGGEEIPGRLTVFMIPVGKWSDGTPDSHDEK